MNLTLKSKSWAGNIYHQFESICQDVDDLMRKDTVRLVENQVQSVGICVKRLYSILPLSEDNAKPESQSTDGEQVTTVNEKQLSENQGSIDNFRNSNASLQIEVESDADENNTKVSTPSAANFISDNEIFSGTSVKDHKSSTPIMREEGLINIATERTAFNDTECLLNTSSSDLLFESKLPMVEDLNCDGKGSLSDPMIASAPENYEGNNLTMDSSDSCACDTSSKDESFDVLSSVQSLERVCSDISYDEEEEKEMGKRTLTSPKSSNILDSISGSFTEKAENVCQSHVESNGSAYEMKAVDVLPDFLIFESNGNTGEFVVGDDDLNMETVDLFPDMKHDETSVILKGNSVHAASHGNRNLRYYKKLIKDALTSRKRLSKEYEHLAVLYGNIDLELGQHFEPNPVPSSPNTSVHAVRTQSFHEMAETEWELV